MSRALPLLLAALSGAAGLGHQLLWVRRMVDILGADAGTFSRVVAAFFLGLALGAWIAAHIHTHRPWRAVALAELAVAALALIVLAAGQFAGFVPANPLLARILDWTLPLLLIVPPAVAMGMVIPWMIRAGEPAMAVPLYAVNTLGGIAGLALAYGWLLPGFGLAGASLGMIALNLSIAVLAGTMPAAPFPAARSRQAPIASPSLAALAFASGFLVLAAEIVIQTQLSQILVSAYYSSALVLALVLAALGLSPFLVPLLDRLRSAALPLALFLAAACFAIQPVALVVQQGGIHYLPFEKPPAEYLAAALSIGIPAVFFVLLPAGTVFPLLLRRATASGIDAGRLLAVNGLGGWLGAELASRALLPIFGLWWATAVVAFGYIATLLACPGRLRWFLLPFAVVLAAWTWQLDGRLPHVATFNNDRVEKVAVGREGVVSILKNGEADRRLLMNNTYTLGGSLASAGQERQALLPVLLHGRATRVATLGVATGSTVAGALLGPHVTAIEGIDLSPLALDFARIDFAPFNRGMASDPRVRLTKGDARRVILQRRGEFDVAVGDLFLPWNTGEGRLFTREHFEGVRDALRPGGLFCQWLPMYQLTRPQFDAILRTFRAVFPDVWIVRDDFYLGMPVIGLVGGRALEDLDWDAIANSCAKLRDTNLCLDPLLRHAEGVAMLVAGIPHAPPPGPEITLANSWIEWDAARNVVGLREKWFTGLPLAEYLRACAQNSPRALPPPCDAARILADTLLALEVARSANLPQARALERKWRSSLPTPLRDDTDADWALLPMRHRPPAPR